MFVSPMWATVRIHPCMTAFAGFVPCLIVSLISGHCRDTLRRAGDVSPIVYYLLLKVMRSALLFRQMQLLLCLPYGC